MSAENDSLEWRSVLAAVVDTDIRAKLPQLGERGVVAYTDGSCIKNPGGPGGWSALLWSAADWTAEGARAGAPCHECYGHIPRATTTTNNRAEISAVLAVLSLAPPTLPLLIYSDSEYTIKVATGVYQMKANPDLWAIYRQLLGYRREKPHFEWVRGHAGHIHNERADELAGWGAFNNDRAAYDKWQSSQAHEAHNRPASSSSVASKSSPARPQSSLAPGDLAPFRRDVLLLRAHFETLATERVGEQERKFIQDIAKRLHQSSFVPSEKQRNWVKGLVGKYKVQ